MTDRTILALTGGDRVGFLDGLITNTVPAEGEGLRYAALLTPQGKFIADFFLLAEGDRHLLDVATSHAAPLFQKLILYRLRADVQIAETDLKVARGTGPAPEGAWPDPRDPGLGWRLYGEEGGDDGTDWDALRVALGIPETGIELTSDSYILEMGFERLGGVDTRKGCFVGQEIVARMKHKTELRKGLARVRIKGAAGPGAEITVAGRPAGTLHTVAGDSGLAYLRFDRAAGEMSAGAATLTRIG